MRRTLLALGAVAGVCLAAAVVCGAVSVDLTTRALRYYNHAAASSSNGSIVDTAEADAQFRAAYVLSLVAEAVTGGFLLAVIAILTLLAWRWRVRRAPAPSDTSDRPAAGTP
jgi:hypothetical protein